MGKSNKTGVLYLSRVPANLKVPTLRQLLSEFGEVGRIYLKPVASEKLSVQKAKNLGELSGKPRQYSDGWVEMQSKRVAKMLAQEVNGTSMEPPRCTNPFGHDLWSLRYLKKTKWADLTELNTYSKKMRRNRLDQALATARRENAVYIQGVQKVRKKGIPKAKKGKKSKLDAKLEA